jgi:glutamine amidotransferase
MRYDLLEHIGPELTSRIEGTTDSEWFYALCLAQLDDPWGPCQADEMAAAVEAALTTVRNARERREIDTQSPVNVVVTDGRSLVATRYVFDYGWYPDDGSFFADEREHDFTTLWYTTDGRYGETGHGWDMAEGATTSVVVASEPLTKSSVGWLETPEYSMLVASPRPGGGLAVESRELGL